MKRLVCTVALLALTVGISGIPFAGASGHPFSLEDPRQLGLVYEVSLSSNAAVSDIELQVPIFTGALPAFQRVTDVTILPPGRLQTDGSGNTYAQARWNSLTPASPVRLAVQVRLEIYRPLYRVDPGLCVNDGRLAGLERYLRPETGIESDHQAIRSCAAKACGNASNPYEMSRQLFAFVNNHMNYDQSSASRGALWALESRRGVCQDYVDLFVALCRTSGIPARRVYGFRYNLRDDGDLESPRLLGDKHHVWAEVYLGDYGWVPVDPTYTYRVNGKKTVNFDYFGSFPSDDLHIATGLENPKMEWRFRYSGPTPSVEASLTETLIEQTE